MHKFTPVASAANRSPVAEADVERFVSTVAAWADSMAAGDYHGAYRQSLDLSVLGRPLVNGLPLMDETFAIEGLPEGSRQELFDGLVGFLSALACGAAKPSGAKKILDGK